jgi:hypothetical protein
VSGRRAGLTERALVLQRVVYAGLDALRLVLAPDLCACLHAGATESPQLYLRSPDLSSLSATEAFTLFSGLRDLLEADEPATTGRTVAGYTAVVRATSGQASRAVWAIGRWDGSFDPYQEEVAVELINGVGAVAHALDDAAAPEEAGNTIRVAVDSQGDRTHAQVWIPVGGSVQSASSDGPSPTIAVAQATRATVNPALKLGNVAEDVIDGERAVLVLVRDVNGRAALGCALCGEDSVRAVAQAAVRAARMM